MNYINKYSDMTAYNADSTKQYPNTAKVESENRVLFQRSDPADLRRVICKYNVTSTSSATKLIGTTTSKFTKQIIDGVEQSSVVKNYTFDTTGEHLVEYEFLNNEIGQTAFMQCPNLATVTIGDAVTSIGRTAFMQCPNLATVTVGNGVTSIGQGAFYDCSGLTSITIPNSVTSIGEQTFNGCSSLTDITIPNSVTYIGTGAFINCTNLTSITISNSVTSIGNSAFYGCTNLTSITIPDSVTSIDYNAFNGCSSLTNVTVEASTPPTLGSNAFANNASGRKIYVPSTSVEAYKTASNWSTYANDIEAIQ